MAKSSRPRPSRRSGGWRHHCYSAGNELRRDPTISWRTPLSFMADTCRTRSIDGLRSRRRRSSEKPGSSPTTRLASWVGLSKAPTEPDALCGSSSVARRTPTAARVPGFASCRPRDRPRFLLHLGFFRKYRDIQPRGVVKASSGETWDWFLFQAFHPTAPHNASLHLLCDFDPLRLDVATRHSQGHTPLTHITQQIFLPFGH